ncbi:hypothetical protein N9277_01150 [bacterium]|nr:hypothetical protein [bacterium]
MKRTLITTICAMGLSVVASQGAAIAVADNSFEGTPGLNAAGDWSNNLDANWSERGGAGNGDVFGEWITGFSSEGTNHIGVNAGAYLWQDTGVAFQANTKYTLSLGAGNRTNQSAAGNLTTYGLLNDATNLGVANYAASSDVTADGALTEAFAQWDAFANVTAVGFGDAPDLTFTTGAVAPTGNVVIFLGADGLGRSHFDNISLDATAIPEPASALLGALSALALLRRRR